MDLEEHLKSLERFSKSLGGVYQGVKGMGESLPWSDEPQSAPPWYPAAMEAIEFLNQAGARVGIEELREGRKGPVIGLRIRSFDADGLKAHLTSLGSARRVAEWVEQGVSLGAIGLRGERIFLQVEPAHSSPSTVGSSLGERGVEATGPISEAAQGIMTLEATATLDLLAQAREAGGGEIRQFRPDAAPEAKQILKESAPSGTGVSRLRRKAKGPKPVMSADELGGTPRFVVTGPAVEMADGTYFPVQAVDATSRSLLGRMGATGVQVGPNGERMLVRAEATEAMSQGESLQGPAPSAEMGDSAGGDRDERISLAYRLLHGMTLAPGEGRPLDVGLADKVERFFGESFSDVRIHSGRIASEVTDALSVEALSMGTHVVIPDTLLNSASGDGERVLIHELAHVRQHTRQDGGSRSEKEADADMAVSRFLAGRGPSRVDSASVASRPLAPAPQASQGMPGGVYASSKRMSKPTARPKSAGPRNLRDELTISRITREVSRQNQRELDDFLDRQG